MPKKQVLIGVFGGTFAPLHYGHLEIAKTARDELGLDLVLFVVAGVPYQKQGMENGWELFSKEDRLLMVEAGVRGIKGFEASDMEVLREGPSYTIDTLKQIHEEHIAAGKEEQDEELKLFLILGADAAGELDTWKSPREIRDLAQLVVVERPGHSAEKLPKDWGAIVLQGPNLDISGSEIRRLLKAPDTSAPASSESPAESMVEGMAESMAESTVESMLPGDVLKVAQKIGKQPQFKEAPYKEESVQLALDAGAAAAEKKASDTKILDVADLLGICDFFVITSGDNPRQVQAISQAIEESLKLKHNLKPICIEGFPSDWLLMDYGDIVVHIFSAPAREYYRLERLWSDCPIITSP